MSRPPSEPTRMRWYGQVWAVVAAAAVVGLSYARWLPQAADSIPHAIQFPVQAGLLGVGLLGVLVGWRWEAVGLPVLAVAGAGLGFLASVQYPFAIALAVAGAVAGPAVLLWLAYRRTRPRRALVAVTAVMLVLAFGVWAGADRLYGYYQGPSHPQSALRVVPADRVVWSWAGALTPSSFTVTARLAASGDRARLAVSAEGDPARVWYSEVQAAGKDSGRAVRLTVTGLRPATRYRYGIEVDGRLDRVARGQLATPPAGPASFRFAFGSDARTGSNGAVFDAIRAADPLFFLQIGDMFYGDVDTDDLPRLRRLYELTLTAPAQAALYRSTAAAYLWDDHDFGANDSDRNSPSKPAASRAYREAVPHYPLPPEADSPIYQAFTVGRVRFLLTDTRSARSPGTDPDDRKTALGAAQRAWLESELLAGRDRYALIVWVSPIPWIEPARAGLDSWGGFDTERRQLADLVASAGIRNLLMLGGDAHMLAIDDGSHSNYSGHGGAGFPVFHAAPLDRLGASKGGPYTLGPRAEGGQFGLVTVQDTGHGPVTVTLSGRTHTGAEVMRYQFTSPQRAGPTG